MMLLDIQEPGQTAKQRRNHAVGIDLGTTHSLVAVVRNEAIEVLADEAGRVLLPSAVWKDKVGYDALGGECPALTSIKRFMGKNIHETETPKEVLTRINTQGLPEFHNEKEWLTAVDFSARILSVLKARAEEALGEKVTEAVITVPAYFDDAARIATKDAATKAGLCVLRLINEPTAAALAYGLDNDAEGIYAIYDLGGGTFDVSILSMQKGVFQVLSTAGDTQLGGDDFDAILAKELNISNREARAIKEALTENENVKGISRQKFEELTQALVARTLTICKQAVSDAGIEKKEIREIVLVGGSTRMPIIKQKVAEFFGKKPLDTVDPDQVVAVGAALQADALSRGSDTLLLDVTPLSLGLETYGGLVEKIIGRNTPIPAAKSQEFTTYVDGQAGMKIHVLQGERELVDQCRSLAFFELTGIPAMPAGVARIKVTFAVDADGLLTVAAEELTTGKKQEVAVKPTYGLKDGEIEAMLKASFENARNDISLRLLQETRVEAQFLLDDLAKAMKADGDLLSVQEREEIGVQIIALKNAMAGDDRDTILLLKNTLDAVCQNFAENRMNRAIGKELVGKAI